MVAYLVSVSKLQPSEICVDLDFDLPGQVQVMS